jgi:hypothetical protein
MSVAKAPEVVIHAICMRDTEAYAPIVPVHRDGIGGTESVVLLNREDP